VSQGRFVYWGMTYSNGSAFVQELFHRGLDLPDVLETAISN